MDLARAAQEAAEATDQDLALDTFVGRLPGTTRLGPRLDLKPRRWVLGTLKSGDTCDLLLTVLNQGRGLLHGTVRVDAGASWLRVGEETSNGECRLKTADQQAVVVEVDTRGLPAPHTYSTKLTVITNGGAAEIPIRLDLAVQPFARPPFQGVSSPREMAERMRLQPKPAVPLLESGEVARWFGANGWTYPVGGPAASGVAAVQQFFEGMGLSKPPPVELSQTELDVTCAGGAVLPCEVRLTTGAKKWVYAHAESDVPWLRVTSPNVSGAQQAILSFEVDGARLEPGAAHEGTLRITANAGQALTLRVRAAVEAAAPLPARGGRLRPLLVGALGGLLLRLAVAVPADFYARLMTGKAGASWGVLAAADPALVKQFVLATWWVGAVLGLALIARKGGRRSDALWGVLAGAAAGLAGAATMACLLPVLDGPPRWVWRVLIPSEVPAWLGTVAGVILAAIWWCLLGTIGAAVFARAGEVGTRAVTTAQRGLAKLCGWCGLKRLADALALGEGGE